MDTLLGIAKKQRIRIVYLPLDQLNNGLFGLHSPKRRTIFLDIKLLQPKYYKLHRCILAEELGHRITGTSVNALSVHKNYSLKRKITQEEERALRWATEILIPKNELLLLLQDGFYSCEDLADYFGVTAWFIFRQLQFMQISCEDKRETIRPILKKAKISCF